MFKKKKDPSAVAQGKTEENLKVDKPPVLEIPKVEEGPSAPSTSSGQVAQGESEDLRELIEKNIKWTQVVYEQNRKIKNRLTLMALGSYIRLALILIPLIAAVIFLPPLLQEWFGQYSDLLKSLGIGSEAVKNGANIDPSQLQDMLQGILKGR